MAHEMPEYLVPPPRAAILGRAHTDPSSLYETRSPQQQQPSGQQQQQRHLQSPPPAYADVMKEVGKHSGRIHSNEKVFILEFQFVLDATEKREKKYSLLYSLKFYSETASVKEKIASATSDEIRCQNAKFPSFIISEKRERRGKKTL